ncbi:MAG: trypsin-like peptidase domain-containing protein [Gammaproteobacteria bacterium]|nr:trypsin-like peptidase domain-containing protein [Gammaproteobacteria bacterium]
MANTWKDSVARVYCDNHFLGTAFLVAPGWALTACHLFFADGQPRTCQQMTLEDIAAWDGRKPQVKRVIWHPEQKDVDVALLQFEESLPDIPYIPLAIQNDMVRKQPVEIAGFDSSSDSRREFSRALSSTDKSGEWLTDIYNASGTSGSPVVYNGCLVGLLHARSQDRNISYVIPLSFFRDFVNAHITESTIPLKSIDMDTFVCLPYLVNYRNQEEEFRTLLQDHRNEENEERKHPLICLIHGREERSGTPHGLALRLKRDLEKHYLPIHEGSGSNPKVELHPFSCGDHPLSGGKALLKEIERSLCVCFKRNEIESVKQIPFDTPVFFYAETKSLWLSKAQIKEFFSFWQTTWADQNHLFLVCLFVHHPSNYWRSLLQKWWLEICVPPSCLLPELQPISSLAVSNWMKIEVAQYIEQHKIRDLLAKLTTLFPNDKPQHMELLAPKLNKLLREIFP